MDCSDESNSKSFTEIFTTNAVTCDDVENDNDAFEITFSESKRRKLFCKKDEASKRKILASSGTDFIDDPATSTENLSKPLKEDQIKKECSDEEPTAMLTCEICKQLFTEDSELTQHLLGHISSAPSFPSYHFESATKKDSESSTEGKSSVSSFAIKKEDSEAEESGLEEEAVESDEDEDSENNEEQENENNFSSAELMPVTPEPEHSYPHSEQNASHPVSISSPPQTSSSAIDLGLSLCPIPKVKQETSPTINSECNKKDQTKVKKTPADTSSSVSAPPKPAKKDLKCEICQREYTRSSTLKRHLRIHSGEKPYSCEVCQKSFYQASDLTQHLRVHTGERPFKCTLCTGAFSQLSALSRHLRCHFGEKPYVCTVCQRAFSQSSALTRHMCSHSEEKLYSCEVCGKSFAWSEAFMRHMRIHTGETPYKCEICAKCFSRSANLSTHMRVHSGEKPFKCPLCDRAFPVSSNLTRHMKTHKDYINEQSFLTPKIPISLTIDSLTEPITPTV